MTVIYFKFEKLPRSNPLVSVIAASLSLQTHACPPARPPARTFILSCVHFSFSTGSYCCKLVLRDSYSICHKEGWCWSWFCSVGPHHWGRNESGGTGDQFVLLLEHNLFPLAEWLFVFVVSIVSFSPGRFLCSLFFFLFFFFFRNISIWKHKQQ